MQFQSIGDFCVVARQEITEVGGIRLSDRSRHFSRIGTVIAIGPGMLRTFPRPFDPNEPVMVSNKVSNTGTPGFDPGMTIRTVEHVEMAVPDRDRFPMQVKLGDRVLLPDSASVYHLDEDNAEAVSIVRECQIFSIVTDEKPSPTEAAKE